MSDQRGEKSGVVLLFVALSLVTLLGSLNQTVFAPALPTLAAELDGLAEMPWVIAAYMLASIPTMPVFGKLSDVFGRKPMILVSVLLFTAGSTVGALAPSMGWLIAGRVIQGIGSGGLVVLPQAAVADVVPARRRAFYVGILGGVFTVSSLIGPYVGGLLTQGPGWRWTFWVNVILGATAALGVLVLLRLPKPARTGPIHLDYAGMALIAVATTSIALVTMWGGNTHPWTSPTIVCLIALGIVAIIAFVLVERHVENPLMPLSFFRDRNFLLTSVASMCVGICMFSIVGYLPTYFQMTLGATPSTAGLLMIPMSVLSLAGSTLSGWLIARTGRYKSYPLIGTLLIATGMAGLGVMTPASPLWWPGVALAVIGFGLGSCFQNLILIVQVSFAHAQVGAATAASSLFRQIGGMFGTTLVGALFIQSLASGLNAQLSPEDFAAVGSSPSPAAIHGLPATLQTVVAAVYNDALTPVYLLMVPIALVATLALSFIEAKPLSDKIE